MLWYPCADLERRTSSLGAWWFWCSRAAAY